MTLVWLACILSVLVAGFVYGWWSISDFTRRAMRDVHRYRNRRDPAEDQAWLNRQAEYEQAMTLTLERAEIAKVDQLVAALERASKPTLEVVA